MKPTNPWRLAIAAFALLVLAPLRALALEDIDIYAGGNSSAPPNVLFYLDNSSNWSSNGNAWSYSTVYAKCTSNYSDTTKQDTCKNNVNLVFCPQNTGSPCASGTTLTQGQVEIRALQLVLRLTHCNATGAKKLSYNAGLMLGATSTDAGSPDDGASVGTSYIRHAIRPMSDDQCASLGSLAAGADLTKYLMADLSNIDAKIQGDDFKTASSFEYGAGLYEGFKYFGGWTRPNLAPGTSGGGATGVAGSPTDSTHFGPTRYSKKNLFEDAAAFIDGNKDIYKSPVSDLGSCGKNYIILIGNTFPNSDKTTNENASPPTNSVLARLGYNPKQLFSVKQKANIRFGDEWAQFLYNTDVSEAAGKQNVGMFAIDVFNAQADANQTALLTSIGTVGQGSDKPVGYFSVGGDLQKLIDSLTDILTDIASVNSVFSAAALPVSVNTQGSYLNQVFMGLFRPDGSAQQRWYGNLKQFKFGTITDVNGQKSLFLSDANGSAAVDTANTGFIKNCAVSYWTGDSGNYWEKITKTLSACLTQTTSSFSDYPDGPIVERGGVAQKLRNKGFANRNLRTCTGSCSSLVDFNTTNVTSINGAADTATLVNWIRGQNTGDGETNALGVTNFTQYTELNSSNEKLDGSSTRPTIHGEVVHSSPLAVNYATTGADVVVFYGSGDGTLRAVDGNQSGGTAGEELWAFVAPEHWSALERVRTNSPLISYESVSGAITPTPKPKTYFFDGPLTGFQDANPLSKLWLYAAMRRGGNMYYAFNVPKKPGTANQPTVLWKFGCASTGTGCGAATGESAMGQSWSPATVIRVKGIDEPLVVFGGGYHTCEDSNDPDTACSGVTQGQGVYVLSAEFGSSQNYRYISPAGGSYTTSDGTTISVTPGRFPAGVTPVDVDGDGYTDVIYAVDTRGNLWRINTSDPSTNYAGFQNGVADWPTPQLVAVVGQWGGSDAERRKFLYGANVIVMSKTQTLVLVGTGDREKPSPQSAAASVRNRFYGIKDSFKTLTGVVPAVGYGAAAVNVNLPDLLNVTGLSTVDLNLLAAKKGWFMDLFTSEAPFEQVVTTPLTIGGFTYFNTYQAKKSDDGNMCSNLGTARGYKIDFLTGAQTSFDPNDPDNLAPVTYKSQGIPQPPVGGQVDMGADGNQWFCLSCAGPNPDTFNPNPVTVAPNPRRTPVYRFRRIDGN